MGYKGDCWTLEWLTSPLLQSVWTLAGGNYNWWKTKWGALGFWYSHWIADWGRRRDFELLGYQLSSGQSVGVKGRGCVFCIWTLFLRGYFNFSLPDLDLRTGAYWMDIRELFGQLLASEGLVRDWKYEYILNAEVCGQQKEKWRTPIGGLRHNDSSHVWHPLVPLPLWTPTPLTRPIRQLQRTN